MRKKGEELRQEYEDLQSKLSKERQQFEDTDMKFDNSNNNSNNNNNNIN